MKSLSETVQKSLSEARSSNMKNLEDIVNENSNEIEWSIYDEEGGTEVTLKMKKRPKYFRICTKTPIPEIVFSIDKYQDDNDSEWYEIKY